MYETSVAISVIQEYMDEHLFEPKSNWPKCEFNIRSYSRWAANYILDLIIKESMKLPPYISGLETRDPLAIIQDFINDLDYYSEISSDNGRMLTIISIAKNTAVDIRSLFV